MDQDDKLCTQKEIVASWQQRCPLPDAS